MRIYLDHKTNLSIQRVDTIVDISEVEIRAAVEKGRTLREIIGVLLSRGPKDYNKGGEIGGKLSAFGYVSDPEAYTLSPGTELADRLNLLRIYLDHITDPKLTRYDTRVDVSRVDVSALRVNDEMKQEELRRVLLTQQIDEIRARLQARSFKIVEADHYVITPKTPLAQHINQVCS